MLEKLELGTKIKLDTKKMINIPAIFGYRQKNKVIPFTLLFLFFIQILKAQVSFTVHPSVCQNDTLYLAANNDSISNPAYSWSATTAGITFSSPSSTITTATFSLPGNYTIVLTAISGTNTYSVQNTVSVSPTPTITLSQSSYTTCIANNSPLFSRPVQLHATGGVSYTWNPSFSSLTGPPNGPQQTVRPTSNFCYSVTGQNGLGCKGTAVACLTVIPRFTIQVSPQYSLICKTLKIHEYAILEAKNPTSPVAGLVSSYTYSWTGGVIGGILTNPLSSTVAVSPSAINTYTVEMLDSLYCISLPAMATVDVENCTNTLENDQNLHLSVYPNPVKDKLSIELKGTSKEKIQFDLINSLGQPVVIINELNSRQELDVSHLPKGIYFLKLQTETQQEVYKVIKE